MRRRLRACLAVSLQNYPLHPVCVRVRCCRLLPLCLWSCGCTWWHGPWRGWTLDLGRQPSRKGKRNLLGGGWTLELGHGHGHGVRVCVKRRPRGRSLYTILPVLFVKPLPTAIWTPGSADHGYTEDVNENRNGNSMTLNIRGTRTLNDTRLRCRTLRHPAATPRHRQSTSHA